MDIDHIALDPPQSQKACTVFVFSEFSYYHHLVHCAPSPPSKTVNEERKTCVVFFEDQTRTGSLNCICKWNKGLVDSGKGGSIQLEQQESIIQGKESQTKTDFFAIHFVPSALPALLARVKFAEKGKKNGRSWFAAFGLFCTVVRVLVQVALTMPQLFFSRRATLPPCTSLRLWQRRFLDLSVWCRYSSTYM